MISTSWGCVLADPLFKLTLEPLTYASPPAFIDESPPLANATAEPALTVKLLTAYALISVVARNLNSSSVLT